MGNLLFIFPPDFNNALNRSVDTELVHDPFKDYVEFDTRLGHLQQKCSADLISNLRCNVKRSRTGFDKKMPVGKTINSLSLLKKPERIEFVSR